ncbi:hypothetical protein BD626DRAFT_66959 [Schizophyllum amplum]|uniref:Uncharacterized protein n=1 Tax=Schizophyllum amplum TaxID=97359 RepID=A0A550CB93_9AGAR|nr:hypothetical protein BD626DRAFT_66959 [Auriculariopsis ampla]
MSIWISVRRAGHRPPRLCRVHHALTLGRLEHALRHLWHALRPRGPRQTTKQRIAVPRAGRALGACTIL